jgi:hypothetical protein
MNFVDFMEAWWLSVRPIIEAEGVVGRLQRSPIDRPNTSCARNIRRNKLEADLVVWESGEAELIVGEIGGAYEDQHFDDIRTPLNLSSILSKLIYSVSDISNLKKP